MSWLKNILVDLLVTAFIIVAVAGGWPWARWVVLGYTGLMLLLKVGALLGRGAVKQLKRTQAGAPTWVFHLLYLVDIVVLALGGWWIAAAGWLAIWLLSYIQQRR